MSLTVFLWFRCPGASKPEKPENAWFGEQTAKAVCFVGKSFCGAKTFADEGFIRCQPL